MRVYEHLFWPYQLAAFSTARKQVFSLGSIATWLRKDRYPEQRLDDDSDPCETFMFAKREAEMSPKQTWAESSTAWILAIGSCRMSLLDELSHSDVLCSQACEVGNRDIHVGFPTRLGS